MMQGCFERHQGRSGVEGEKKENGVFLLKMIAQSLRSALPPRLPGYTAHFGLFSRRTKINVFTGSAGRGKKKEKRKSYVRLKEKGAFYEPARSGSPKNRGREKGLLFSKHSFSTATMIFCVGVKKRGHVCSFWEQQPTTFSLMKRKRSLGWEDMPPAATEVSTSPLAKKKKTGCRSPR